MASGVVFVQPGQATPMSRQPPVAATFRLGDDVIGMGTERFEVLGDRQCQRGGTLATVLAY